MTPSHRRYPSKPFRPTCPKRRRLERFGRFAVTAAVGLVVAFGSTTGSDRPANPESDGLANPESDRPEGFPTAEGSGTTTPRVDLIAHSPWDGSQRSVMIVQIIGLDSQATSLRAKLYEEVADRSDLATAITGNPNVEPIWAWPVEIPDRTSPHQTTSSRIQIRLPDDAANELLRRIKSGTTTSGLWPLHLDLSDTESGVLHTMRAFLHASEALNDGARTGANPGLTGDSGLAVASVFDLRLPLAHDTRYTARFDPSTLSTTVDSAVAISSSAIAARENPAITVVLHPETLDALALTGDDPAADALLEALLEILDRTQLLLSTWTDLDTNAVTAAGRGDIALDSILFGKQAQRRADISTSSVMWLDTLPTPQAATWLTRPSTGVTAFAVRASGSPTTASVTAGSTTAAFDTWTVDPPPPVSPVAALTDTDGVVHHVTMADPFLEWLLSGSGTGTARRRPGRTLQAAIAGPAEDIDPELAVQHLLTELLRLARSDSRPEAIVVYTPIADPEIVRLLLDALQEARVELRPVTITTVLAESAPVSTAEPERPGTDALNAAGTDSLNDQRDYLAYLDQRTAIEQRLDAYESLVDGNATLIHPLQTLLTASSAESLRNDERDAFLATIDNRIKDGTTGIEVAPADRITVIADTVDLPLAVINNQPAPVTVVVEINSASDEIRFPGGNRRSARLDPGRNRLSIPVETVIPLETVMDVTIATPGADIPIVLATGHRSVRFVRLPGVGAAFFVCASMGLALWWIRNRKHRHAERLA